MAGKPLALLSQKNDTDKDWNGNYWHNSGQVIETEDAQKLAEALEKVALFLFAKEVDIPDAEYDHDPVSHLPRITNHDQIPIENFFSGAKDKQAIIDFIEFCKEGSFKMR